MWRTLVKQKLYVRKNHGIIKMKDKYSVTLNQSLTAGECTGHRSKMLKAFSRIIFSIKLTTDLFTYS